MTLDSIDKAKTHRVLTGNKAFNIFMLCVALTFMALYQDIGSLFFYLATFFLIGNVLLFTKVFSDWEQARKDEAKKRLEADAYKEKVYNLQQRVRDLDENDIDTQSKDRLIDILNDYQLWVYHSCQDSGSVSIASLQDKLQILNKHLAKTNFDAFAEYTSAFFDHVTVVNKRMAQWTQFTDFTENGGNKDQAKQASANIKSILESDDKPFSIFDLPTLDKQGSIDEPTN